MILFETRAVKLAISALVVAVSIVSVGATRYEFAPIAKGDRADIVGNCLDVTAADNEACRRAPARVFTVATAEAGVDYSIVSRIQN